MKKVKQCIIHGKKLLCLLLCVVSIINLTSCARYGEKIKEEQSLSMQENADAIMAQVLEALNNHDEEKLTGIFSENARNNVSNIADMSEIAIDFFEGTGEIVESKYMITEKKSERGTISVAGTSKYTVQTEDQMYIILVVFYERNDFDESMEGLYLLQITTEDFYNQDGFKWKNKDYEPGIYIQNERADEYIPTGELVEPESK